MLNVPRKGAMCRSSAGTALEWQRRKRAHTVQGSASARHPPAGTCPQQLYPPPPAQPSPSTKQPSSAIRRLSVRRADYKRKGGITAYSRMGEGWGGLYCTRLVGRHTRREGVRLPPFINSPVARRPSVRSSQSSLFVLIVSAACEVHTCASVCVSACVG